MENGFLYSAYKVIVDNLKYLNLVELFKTIAVRINPQKKVAYSRIGTDIFIVLKWIFVFVLWFSGKTSCLLTISIWYLIATNIYTYFFYHIWCDDALDTSGHDSHRIRRRFVILLLAVAFSDFCFAYLYRFPFSTDFSNTATGNSIWFSVSNSLAANYSIIQPTTDFGNSVAMTQLIMTFIFVTIIISRSIPQKC